MQNPFPFYLNLTNFSIHVANYNLSEINEVH